jgi:hypothetical protein
MVVINFENIISVTRWAHEDYNHPCFALFLAGRKRPYLFLCNSEKQLEQWTSQISIYCSQLTGINSLRNACTMTSTDGYNYYAFLHDEPLFIKQIQGSLKLVEKHSNGLTFGIGHNGKLWILTKTKYSTMDSYTGPFTQTDDIQINTYENQRWNAVSGLMGLRNGFTSVGLPSDRSNWSDEKGKIRQRREDFKLPSTQFSWVNKWQVDFDIPNGCDSMGWQYAIDFPLVYHAQRTAIDFVRRRRWTRKYNYKSNGTLWKEIYQTHLLTSISFDQEKRIVINENSETNSISSLVTQRGLLPDKMMLVWATDTDGFVLYSLIDETDATNIRWQHVPSQQKFQWVSIGVDLRVWGIDANGDCQIRYGVDIKSNYAGTGWTIIDLLNVQFIMVSAGKDSVWAVSRDYDLYFRDNITKFLPEGTQWTKVCGNIKYVTINRQNRVERFQFKL